MDQQSAQVPVSPLADPQEPVLAARAVLLGCEPQRGGHLAAVGELSPVTHGGDQSGRGDRPDAAQLLQALGCRVFLGDRGDLRIELVH